ncbi:hypothetical protein Back2_14190 [Nocardioides baekrokdamisoli]|uniref:Sulfotransferase domain-containing protein n=1 Tax=Nocardioides baekrokdamisoli TaxID=1804624 RepID=A0A3G9IFL3_9ACTN|nr:sulfotransferase domain-containing protein [Nocardioides baekrokdamisoli]BBH17132.1 hypothetical protein Back2_14190 [Nocardioides baekrokdamisoli]
MGLRSLASSTVQWQPARNAIKVGVRGYAHALGTVRTVTGTLPAVVNLYTASSPKGGSQFMKELFSHPIVEAHTSLFTLPQRLYQEHLDRPVPAGTYVPGVHMSWDEFLTWPKRGTWRVIYMHRDPRELFVSGYFSAVGVHRPMPHVEEFRAHLRTLPQAEGLLESIRFGAHRVAEMGTWVDVQHPDVLQVRLEDVEADPETWLPKMLEHAGVSLSSQEMAAVMADVSRESMQARDLALRPAGSESHYRVNRLSYRDLFGPEHFAACEAASSGLAQRLGYPD